MAENRTWSRMTAMYSTPILYLNMGGEMLYVLQQRLQSQKISADKTIIGQLHEFLYTVAVFFFSFLGLIVSCNNGLLGRELLIGIALNVNG